MSHNHEDGGVIQSTFLILVSGTVLQKEAKSPLQNKNDKLRTVVKCVNSVLRLPKVPDGSSSELLDRTIWLRDYIMSIYRMF